MCIDRAKMAMSVLNISAMTTSLSINKKRNGPSTAGLGRQVVSKVSHTAVTRPKALGKLLGAGARKLPMHTRAEASEDVAIETAADGRLKASWSELSRDLKAWRNDGLLKSITPTEACAKFPQPDEGGEGWEFVDVQTEEDFGKVHAIGSISIPLFTPIGGNSFVQMQRKIGFALGGNLNGTEENPELVESFEIQCDMNKDQPVILICGIGGSLEAVGATASNGTKDGERSRSLIVAHRLLKAGFTQVNYVEGGVRQWFREELPTTLTHDEL